MNKYVRCKKKSDIILKIECGNKKKPHRRERIFASDATIRSRDISNVLEFLAIPYWIRVAHFIRICLISCRCRARKLRYGNVWMGREQERADSTRCSRVKLGGEGEREEKSCRCLCRIDRVWRERQKIKREKGKRLKKWESAIALPIIPQQKTFLYTTNGCS